MEELGLLANVPVPNVQFLFANFGEEPAFKCMETVQILRKKGIVAELYPDAVKLKKQISYADKKQIPYLVMVGSEELEKDFYTLKDMKNGTQKALNLQALLDLVF